METKEAREAYWQAHVLAWRRSGQTQRAYCAEHGLNPHGLSYWQLRLRAKEQEVEPEARPPLTLVRAIAPTTPPAPTSMVSLHSPTGWRLEFTTLPPATWLSELWRGQA